MKLEQIIPAVRVTKDDKQRIADRIKELKYKSETEYIRTLIEKDLQDKILKPKI